jgi:hypothetical protein
MELAPSSLCLLESRCTEGHVHFKWKVKECRTHRHDKDWLDRSRYISKRLYYYILLSAIRYLKNCLKCVPSWCRRRIGWANLTSWEKGQSRIETANNQSLEGISERTRYLGIIIFLGGMTKGTLSLKLLILGRMIWLNKMNRTLRKHSNKGGQKRMSTKETRWVGDASQECREMNVTWPRSNIN